MAVVTKEIEASPADVFAILADGWLYASWVVGAAHIRAVDEGWPDVGSRIHHNIAPWPLSLSDTTAVRRVEAPRLLELDAWAWPFGAALVRLELAELGPGRTRVTMTEHVSSGPAKLVPGVVQDLLLTPRNNEALDRLGDLATGRAATDVPRRR
ncbi:Polyketide cyclase / dehydrase and lipid transport [Actinokineospora alba]|uniref:Polyketide cyclase / dehydrase and lipid transport n=1 Tax=Actinokineospora alba TaxID=504798 RepID=A0A1H0VHA7_9PSEU|nr:SRPBCC family protein [Actinokineospora alba]TDP67735.1 polyketide cyclase/dehydrase/lipid transport protein [Actinokineospora alba]SDJ27150.1 Polyketide cyclase / dehydrase and lipid transport [Actinokineospora alba]SDP77724.1 Polyketide cyclase / dehydrase and lipid transport [Actinokineospora alba]